jgi:hypothetical protein
VLEAAEEELVSRVRGWEERVQKLQRTSQLVMVDNSFMLQVQLDTVNTADFLGGEQGLQLFSLVL